MTDQQILNKVTSLEKTVEASDGRTLRLGEKTEKLKDSVQTDLFPRLARIEGRVDMLVWIVGIALTSYLGLFIAGGVQLYLLNGRLSGIETDIHQVRAAVDGIRLGQASENPTNPSSIAEAQVILHDAKSRDIRISQREINESAARFLEASSFNPESWKAAIAFVDYKSFLNATDDRFPGLLKPLANSGFTLENPIKGPINFGLAGPLVMPDRAPQIKLLDSPYPNPRDVRGHIPEYIRVNGGSLAMDGFYMKQVILDKVHVVYHGGRVKLENVYFVNCTFELEAEPQKPQVDFARTLLAAPSVTFNIG